jgi:hypothetical protein
MECTGCGNPISEFKAWVVSPPRDHYALFCSKACIASFFAPDRTTLALPLPASKPELSPQHVVVDSTEDHPCLCETGSGSYKPECYWAQFF